MRDLYQKSARASAIFSRPGECAFWKTSASALSRARASPPADDARGRVDLLNELKFGIVNFFPALVDDIGCVEKILRDRYLRVIIWMCLKAR